MSEQKEKIRAIGLLSGGLDSILAVRTVMSQGVDVLALHFISPFFGADKRGREAERGASRFAGFVETAPGADEGVPLPLLSDRGGVGVAGVDGHVPP